MAGKSGRRKCKICDGWIEIGDESVEYKNGHAHRTCFNIAMKVAVTEKKETLATTVNKKKVKAAKPQKELKDGLSEEEYKDKCNLCDYVRNLIKEDLSVKIYKLIEDYKKKYSISYQEMYKDLFWYFEIQEHEIDGDIVGIIPYCHSEAQKYYQSIERANASCQENLKKLPNMYKETTAAISNERQSKVQEINIAAIGGDE